MDDFNAIRALNLQFEMQKAGSTHGTGSFMKKAKRLAIIVCAIAMLMSILAIPASAATQDH